MKSRTLNCQNLVTTTDQHMEKNNQSTGTLVNVLNPDFDLGLGDKWTAKFLFIVQTLPSQVHQIQVC